MNVLVDFSSEIGIDELQVPPDFALLQLYRDLWLATTQVWVHNFFSEIFYQPLSVS